MDFGKTIRSRRGRFGKDDRDFHKPKSPPAINSKNIIQRDTRSFPTKIAFNQSSQNQLYLKIKNYLNSNNNYYLGFGGTGDALLVLAACWDDPKGKTIFFANSSSISLTLEIFNLFKAELLINENIMGQPIAKSIFDLITKYPTFKTSGHLADRLDYGDWRLEQKYIPRIVKKVPWAEEIGKIEKNHIIICPSGSNKSHGRQRYITEEECKNLVKKHLDASTVYINVSPNDVNRYWLAYKNCFILTSKFIKDCNKVEEKINIKKMLQIIHGAKEVISVDTYLKTYSLMTGIPTTVIETRWNGSYKKFGEDITDWIFLNPRIWTAIKIQTIEDLLI
jgi:hypothetical protein